MAMIIDNHKEHWAIMLCSKGLDIFQVLLFVIPLEL